MPVFTHECHGCGSFRFEQSWEEHSHELACPGCGERTDYVRAQDTSLDDLERQENDGGIQVLVKGRTFAFDPKCRIRSFAGTKRTADQQEAAYSKAVGRAKKMCDDLNRRDPGWKETGGARISGIYPSELLFSRRKQFGLDYLRDIKSLRKREGLSLIKD